MKLLKKVNNNNVKYSCSSESERPKRTLGPCTSLPGSASCKRKSRKYFMIFFSPCPPHKNQVYICNNLGLVSIRYSTTFKITFGTKAQNHDFTRWRSRTSVDPPMTLHNMYHATSSVPVRYLDMFTNLVSRSHSVIYSGSFSDLFSHFCIPHKLKRNTHWKIPRSFELCEEMSIIRNKTKQTFSTPDIVPEFLNTRNFSEIWDFLLFQLLPQQTDSPELFQTIMCVV